MFGHFTALFSAKALKKLSIALAVVSVPTFSISANARAEEYAACIRNDSGHPVFIQWGFHGSRLDETVIDAGRYQRFYISLSPGNQFNRRLLIGLYDAPRSSGGKNNYNVIPSPASSGFCFSEASIRSTGYGQFYLVGEGARPEFTQIGHWSDSCGGWCRYRN
ncbi:MAG: hypothetical protein F6K11_00875 [Leptolyngbya sp. SIO3F4]|nr:hypothetical protein [Leptolyngbya sp. SIO3F4]